MKRKPSKPAWLKFNKEYVFINNAATFRIVKIVSIKKRFFVKIRKSDAVNSINGFAEVVAKSSVPVPLTGYFEWQYDLFKDLIEKDWSFLGEL
jgi:hypothetical protein